MNKAGNVFLAALGSVGFGVYAHQQRSQCLAAVPLVEANSVISGAAPEFSLKDVDGREVTLSQFKGKVILVNYWVTRCGLCRVEMPALMEFQDKYPLVRPGAGDKLAGNSEVQRSSRRIW